MTLSQKIMHRALTFQKILCLLFVLLLQCESILSVPHTPRFISAMKTLAMRSVAINFHVKRQEERGSPGRKEMRRRREAHLIQ
jgi:hypothetical protein